MLRTARSSGSTRRETTCCRLVDDLRGDRDRVDRRGGGGRACPPRPVIVEREEVAAAMNGPGIDRDLAVLERRPQVAAVDEVHAVDDAGGDEVARAAGGELLGGLEEEAQLAAGQRRARRELRAAPSSIAVCPSWPQACIDARLLGGERRRRSAPRSAARRCRRAARSPGRGGRCAGARDAGLGRALELEVVAEPVERLGDPRRGLVLLEAQLGVAMQVAPPLRPRRRARTRRARRRPRSLRRSWSDWLPRRARRQSEGCRLRRPRPRARSPAPGRAPPTRARGARRSRGPARRGRGRRSPPAGSPAAATAGS